MVKINKEEIASLYKKALKEENYEQLVDIENKIIATKNGEYIYKFACNVLGTDRTNLTDGIIKTNNLLYIYYFARDVKNLTKKHILKLENCIINSGNFEIMLMFARDVDRADTNLITSKVLNMNNYDNIINYMRFVKLEGSDVYLLNMKARSIVYEGKNDSLKAEYWSTIHEIFDNKHQQQINYPIKEKLNSHIKKQKV